MKVKVAEASDVVLDYMVAMCNGKGIEFDCPSDPWLTVDGIVDQPLHSYTPSTDWAQGGPIIERKRISMLFDAGSACRESAWFATPDDQQVSHGYEGENFDPAFMVYEADGCYGPTALVAAMRCLVTSRLGEEVEVPDELF